jgi:hypothetical protein
MHVGPAAGGPAAGVLSWGQTLKEHYHVHCVVSGGGLSLDGRSWVALPKGQKKRRRPFLFPVTALSRVFRSKFTAGLQRARRQGTLRYLGQSAALAELGPWDELMTALWQQDWIVYAKAPFSGPEHVLKYLSRYTHRVAISNQRLLAVTNGVVRFEYHDYADPNARKELSLPASEFLRRFLLHVVPKGFMRIRHYGITANARRQEKLARCRELLATLPAPPAAPPLPAGADTAAAVSEDTTPRCPQCGALLRIIEILSPQPHDTS